LPVYFLNRNHTSDDESDSEENDSPISEKELENKVKKGTDQNDIHTVRPIIVTQNDGENI